MRRLERVIEQEPDQEDYRRDAIDIQIEGYRRAGYDIKTIAEFIGMGWKTVHERLNAIEQGISYRKYKLKELIRYARKKGCDSVREYRTKLAKRRGYKSPEDAISFWLKEKGVRSLYEYSKSRIRKPDRWIRNKNELSRVIKERLRELGMTQSDLARKSGLSRQVISLYANAVDFPLPENARILARTLKVPYKDIKRIAPWN